MILIPVSLSRKVHLKNGNVVGELIETRLDDEVDSAIIYCIKRNNRQMNWK